MALDTTRMLRIGVVFRGQIVAERVLDRRIDVTVGTRPESTIQVNPKDYPEFPASVALALIHGGAYHAVLPPNAAQALSLRGGAPGSAESAKAHVVTVKGMKAVPIDAFTGGSVTLGDIILMFQFVRGDAVPTITREETVLRIGLVHDDRLLSDQVFRGGQPVRIGTSGKSAIALPDVEYQGVGAKFTPIPGKSAFRVTLPKGTGMRVAFEGSAPLDEPEMLKKGVARIEGDLVTFELPLKARGRASLGPYTLLYQALRQSVTVPAVPRKSVLGQLASPFVADSPWTVSVVIAFLVIGSIVGQAILFHRTTGRFLKKSALDEELAGTTYEVLIEEKEDKKDEPKPDILSAQAKKAAEKEKEEEKKKPQPKEKPQSVGKQIDPEELKRQAREAVVKKSIAGALVGSTGAATKLFGTAGEGEDGTVVAKTFGSEGAGDADGQGPGTGLKLAGSGEGGGTMERVAHGGAKGFGDRASDDTKVEQRKQEAMVKISLSNDGLEGTGSSKGDVAKVISRKNTAVQRCYEQALRDNPDVGGKVKVTFTVGTAGTVTEVSVSGASGGFADCIQSKFTSIRGLPLLPTPQSFSQSYVFSKS